MYAKDASFGDDPTYLWTRAKANVEAVAMLPGRGFRNGDCKGKDRRRKRVKLHRLLDQDRKAVDARPEVDRFAMQVDLEISVQFEHDSTLP